MFRLARFLKPYWKWTVLAPLLMVLEVLADLYQPLLMANIADEGIARGDIGVIWQKGLLMVAVALLGMVGGIGCTIAASYASQSFGADLRKAVFDKVQRFSAVNLDKFTTPSLITRLTNDVTQVQMVVLMGLRIMVRAPLLSLGGIVMAVAINARLSMILLVILPLMVLGTALLFRRGFRLFSLVQERIDKVNSVMRENLAGVRVIKAFVRHDFERKRFGRANENLVETTMAATRLVALAMPLIGFIMNASIVAILWFGGLQTAGGTITVGEIIAFINYMIRILMALMMLSFVFIALTRAKVSADRVNEVLDEAIDVLEPTTPTIIDKVKGEIVFDGVSFRFPGAKGDPVLKDISFRAAPGETIGILGGTGSGKSTLVHLLLRFYDPIAGQILLDGVDLRKLPLSYLRGLVGMVFQDTILFSGSVAENIRWGKRDASQKEVEEAACIAQADEFVSRLPSGYESLLDQRAANLSGGQKQRLAISRALVKDAAILVIDDCTSAVDLGTEARIQSALRRRAKRQTTLIIAQRITSVMDADRILVLDDCQIVAQGKHEDLLKTSSVYQDIYRSQIREEEIG